MSNNSSNDNNSNSNNNNILNIKKSKDTIPCRIEFIKKILGGKNISPLVNFENTDTEHFVGCEKDEDGSGESYDTRIVLNKKKQDFIKIILSINGDDNQLEYIKSGTTGHTFKGSVKNKDKSVAFEYGVKVVAYPKREKYGSIYDVRRPENAELKMLKVLSYFVIKRQTPHIVLPIGVFDTNIKIFTQKEFMDVINDDEDDENEKYQEFLEKYKKGEYDDTVSVLISEWANRGDLLEYLRKSYNNPRMSLTHWKSFFFQILSVLTVIQLKFPAFRHNDLKANNVLIHRTDSEEDCFTYKIAKKKYRVTNVGYQLKLWDFDFACIPGIVDNKKVEMEWTRQINVIPKQNRYYDVHYFFNTLIKRGFVEGIMTSDKVPQEVKDFINRVIPKKYRNDPKAHKLKKLINEKLQDKYRNLYEKYQSLYVENDNKESNSKKKDYYNLAKKYSELYNKSKEYDFGAKFIHNYYIPSEIKSAIMEIIPEDHGVLIGYVHEKGRLLLDDEYITPQKLIEEDPFFEEFRFFNDNGNNNTNNRNNNTNNNENIEKYTMRNKNNAPNINNFLQTKKHYDFINFDNMLGGEEIKEKEIKKKKKSKNNSKKSSKNKSKNKSKKSSKNTKKKSKSRTISDDIKKYNMNEILGNS